MTIKNPKELGPGLPKIPGYLRMFGRYVSLRFLLMVFALPLTAGILYSLLLHVYVAGLWYTRQTLPEFTLDSPYLAGYDGRARLLMPDGSLLYEGEIQGTAVTGNGSLYRSGKLLYEGAFLDNKYNGQGSLYRHDGSLRYAGEFMDNLFHGSGVLYGEDGAVCYKGMFENDLYHGRGTLYFTEKKESYTYTGEFAEGVRSGEGKLLRGGGLLYEGGFLENKYDGAGKLYQKGALVYEGEFAAGLYNGSGIEYNPETGHKVFEGRYLAGKRMAAGMEYDENGEPPVELPELFDALSLLGQSYEKTCTALIKAGVSYRLVSPQDGTWLLIDDTGGMIYVFNVDEITGEPLFLAQVYLCSLYAVHSIVIGSDIQQTMLTVSTESDPGSLTGNAETFALTLSNLYWGRDAKMADVGSMGYVVDNLLLTAYYLPAAEPAARETEDDGGQITNTPAARQGGIVLFVKADYLFEGGGK